MSLMVIWQAYVGEAPCQAAWQRARWAARRQTASTCARSVLHATTASYFHHLKSIWMIRKLGSVKVERDVFGLVGCRERLECAQLM